MKPFKRFIYLLIFLFLLSSFFGGANLIFLNFFSLRINYPDFLFYITAFSLILTFLLSLKQLSLLDNSPKIIYLFSFSSLLLGINYLINVLFKKGILTLLISNILLRKILGGIIFGIFPIILSIWLFIQVFIKKNLIDETD
ncbi:hypothetical protein GYA25_02575 [Candidatus Woesearchaeota archaeon]|nr:hypothetical protein [Candidatus Woesearchaeota archaeon]